MKLLPDKPLSHIKKQDLDFAYTEFAESLAQIIENAPRPFTIGMFGKWGAGKSTIIQNLEDKLDERKYIYLGFDVWKYEADALRRSFLIDIAEQLNQKRSFLRSPIDINKLENELYKAETFNKEKFKPSWRSLLVILATMAAVFLFSKKTQNPSTTVAATVSAASIGVAVVIIDFFRKIDPSMLIQKVSLTRTPIGSPEQFERIFRETILKRTRKTYVIVIDNLDRTQKDKTVELLSTVKTFLNADASNDRVIFVIACDDRAIKEHIESVYSNTNQRKDSSENSFSHKSEFSSNEFLRKFFNVVVELPILIEVEVNDFTKKTLKAIEIPEFDNTDLQLIINFAYQDNPREIKQFINNFAAYYLLLNKEQVKNGLPKKFLKRNLNFICKMLVIRDRYQDIFDHIRKLNAQAKPWSIIAEEIASTNNKEFKDFDDRTKNWTDPSEEYISWFFRLRRSKEDIALPGWTPFINFASQQNIEESQKLFESFGNKIALNNQLKVYINKIANEPARITPFFAVYIKLILTSESDTKGKLQDSTDLLIQSTPAAADLGKIIGLIDVDGLVHDLKDYIKQRSMRKFVNTLKSMLEIAVKSEIVITEDHLLSIINALYHESETLKDISDAVHSLIKDKYYDVKILETLKDKSNLKDTFIDHDVIRKYIEAMDRKDPEPKRKLEVLTTYSLADNMDLYLTKTFQVLQEVDSRDNTQKHEMVIVVLETLKNQTLPLVVAEKDIPSIIAITQIVDKWYSEITEIDRRPEVLLLSLLASIHGNSAENLASSCLSQFITQNSIVDIADVLRDTITATVRAKNEIQIVIRDKMATNTADSIKLLPYIDISYLPYVIEHIRQKAIDATTDTAFTEQMAAANHLYTAVEDQHTKDIINEEVINAINSRISDFPAAVKKVIDRRHYSYISAQQKHEILSTLQQNGNVGSNL